MKKTFFLIYAVAAAIMAVITVINQTQPALFFINIFAKLLHNKFPAGIVVIFTTLIYLSPLLIVALIIKFIRITYEKNVGPNDTGIFITRIKTLSNGLWSMPVYINDEKVGVVDNGYTKFFNAPVGTFTLQAGNKKRDPKLEIHISEGEQLHVELEVVDVGGIHPVCVLKEMESGI